LLDTATQEVVEAIVIGCSTKAENRARSMRCGLEISETVVYAVTLETPLVTAVAAAAAAAAASAARSSAVALWSKSSAENLPTVIAYLRA